MREPSPVIIPGSSNRLSASARDALRRHRLYTVRWRARLEDAPSRIIHFIERYHRVSGFQYVLRAYYGSRYGRRQSIALLRLMHDLKTRAPAFRDYIRFSRDNGIDEDGEPVLVVTLRYRSRWYRALPSGRTVIRRV